MNNKRWNFDLVGVLTDESIFHEKFGRQSIFRNHQNVIQFNIRMMTRPPENFPSAEYFTGFSHDLEEWGFEDIVYLRDEERVARLRAFLDDMLIVFQPERRILQDNKTVYVAQNMRVVRKVESFQSSDILIPMPIFSQLKHGYSYKEFLFRLNEGKYLGRLDNFSQDPEDTPPFILWKNNDDSYHVFGRFEKHHHAYGGFKFLYTEGFRSIPLNEQWLYHAYQQDHILYVPLHIFKQIDENMNADGAVLHIRKSDPALANDHTQHNMRQKTEADQVEQQFLERLVSMTRDQGLFYEEKDLFNFHTAMKISDLVILSGMSGTGKSRLVHAYAKALGLGESQLTFIPVRPSWTDDADLLGYPDTLHSVYRPGDTELINTLIEAEKEENQDKLYIVCFDEMNLARVEHYFSQFLSVLELGESRRTLRLYNDDLVSVLQNASIYKPTIELGDNVLFVGTVNIDESTYHFSDKVLDRANVIELNVLPFQVLKTIPDRKTTLTVRQTVDFPSFEKMKHTGRTIELTDEEITFFWTFHEAMQRLGRHLGISPRVIRQIDRYVKNIPLNPEMNRSDALDIQVVQRILTKIRGTEEKLGSFFGPLSKAGTGAETSRFIELLDHHQSLSHFKKTRKIAEQIMKELRDNGYTL